MRLRRAAISVAATAALMLGAAGPALARELEPIEWAGQGTDNGVCADVEVDADVPAGSQLWHFVLNQQGDPGATTMDASFDDGTTVTGHGPDQVSGQVAHFFVETAAGAALLSATAYPAGDQGPNPQFVVSHCLVSEEEDDKDKKDKKKHRDGKKYRDGKKDRDKVDRGKVDRDEKDDDAVAPVPDDKKPMAVPTSVPAGYGDTGGGASGTAGLIAAFAGALAAGALLIRRRFLHEN
jgi:hypothetical protein